MSKKRMDRRASGGAALAALLLFAPAVAAQETGGDVAAGKALAVQTCSACHLVGASQQAPDRSVRAPAFRDVANMPATTTRSLYVFLHTPHPSMPNLILSQKEADDVISYIMSLRTRSGL